MCFEQVDGDLLEKFTQGSRMTISQQQKFCRLHREKSAREHWDNKGYPNIDWHSLDSRIEEHYGVLREILEGGASHYGNLFSQRIRSGGNKTLFKSAAESLTPGYYGSRGLKAMTENLVNEFSSLLRKRSVQDRLISARGNTAYIQAVLVPELTVRLITEDMSVDEETARSILQESIWVGDLLNEELGDVVRNEDDGDEVSSSLLSLSDNE
jgi:hypothetical protein